MNTQQLEYVLMIEKEKSFSAAAEKLFITQPSLSQYISKLEKQLGTVLFDRSTKPLSLTSSGQAYVTAAKEILRMEKELTEKIAELENIEAGNLRIGAVSYHSSYLLPESIVTFHKRYPGITITIYEDGLNNLYERLREGSIDLIVASEKILPLEFDVEVLAEEKVYLAIPDTCLPADDFMDCKLTGDDIMQESERFLYSKDINLDKCPCMPFILSDAGDEEQTQLEKLYSVLPIDTNMAIHVSSKTAAFSYAVAGVGACLVTDSFICHGNIKKHPGYYSLPDDIAKLYICMIMRRQEQLPKIVRTYGQVLKDLVAIGTWRRMNND